jgi:hypothetical protein
MRISTWAGFCISLAVFLGAPACTGGSGDPSDPAASSREAAASPQENAALPHGADHTEECRFFKHAVWDSEGFDMEAQRLLLPEGWRFEGGITWNWSKFPEDPSFTYRITSPDGRAAVEEFKSRRYFWSQNQILNTRFSEAGNEIQEPVKAADYLENLFFPDIRRGVSQIRVLQREALPEFAEKLLRKLRYRTQVSNSICPIPYPFETDMDAGRIRVEYTVEGEKRIEDLNCLMAILTLQLPGMFGDTITGQTWTASVCSFTAPAEEMPSRVSEFRIITASRSTHLEWDIRRTRVIAAARRDGIRSQQAVNLLFQQIRRTPLEFSDMIQETYDSHNHRYDAIFDDYSQYLPDMADYHDPVNDWNLVLPSEYDHVWTNGDEYLLTHDALLDPNLESIRNWERLERRN